MNYEPSWCEKLMCHKTISFIFLVARNIPIMVMKETQKKITVKRGSSGFGLSLVYRGTDRFEKEDTGIFVSKLGQNHGFSHSERKWLYRFCSFCIFRQILSISTTFVLTPSAGKLIQTLKNEIFCISLLPAPFLRESSKIEGLNEFSSAWCQQKSCRY